MTDHIYLPLNTQVSEWSEIFAEERAGREWV